MKAVFISHGGGPLPLLGDPGHDEMVQVLKKLASGIVRPKRILVISAHWEENQPTLTAGPETSLLYDYYGFPEESYSIEYSCPGDPELVQQVSEQLSKNGFNPVLNNERGLDHGVFVPLKIMFPKADIPVVQLSLIKGLDPETHIRMGMALAELEDVLVVGSGFSFHNLRVFFSGTDKDLQKKNREFEGWLKNTVSSVMNEEKRVNKLTGWENAPHARFCHPREEHLLPLHVCYGLARSPASQYTSVKIYNWESSFFSWK